MEIGLDTTITAGLCVLMALLAIFYGLLTEFVRIKSEAIKAVKNEYRRLRRKTKGDIL